MKGRRGVQCDRRASAQNAASLSLSLSTATLSRGSAAGLEQLSACLLRKEVCRDAPEARVAGKSEVRVGRASTTSVLECTSLEKDRVLRCCVFTEK